ncbi:MAG: acyl-CoA--6-aminopenicillanic acid acyltransferase [Rhodospirillales bacterium]|nr:acyl-CoA--6-aminopenicillanic acid acyltransferase [Rhodospirillales bacterium]MDE2573932.1 acyl-CoA--6-aminopenicillanic acid acyltransferase [Rhodospirillales bacterium]
MDAFPLIEISGPAHVRGQQYGRQAAARIRRGIAHYASQLAAMAFDTAAVAELVRTFLPIIEQFEAGYIQEMRGIAEGAEVAFEDIVLLNARTEILKLATRPALRARLAAQDGCTGVVVLPEAARARQVIHAQNWDWKAECAETAIVLRIRNPDGPDVLTFTEAGGLARSGLNAAGIAITANYLQSDRDYRDIGVPLALIRRKALEQPHLALAMHAVHATAKSAANNMIVSGSRAGEGVAIDFECAPDEAFLLHPEAGLLVHANHFVSPVALAKLRDTGIAATPCSIYRDRRVHDLLAPRRGAITLDDVKAALADDFATPWSVCRPPRAGMDGTLTATVATVVMQPALGVMEVAPLPALGATFTRYTLEMERAARAAAE